MPAEILTHSASALLAIALTKLVDYLVAFKTTKSKDMETLSDAEGSFRKDLMARLDTIEKTLSDCERDRLILWRTIAKLGGIIPEP